MENNEDVIKSCMEGMRNYADHLSKQRNALGGRIPIIFANRWMLRIDGLKNLKRLKEYIRLGVLLLYVRYLAFRIAIKLAHVEDNIYESEAILDDHPVRHNPKKLGFIKDK